MAIKVVAQNVRGSYVYIDQQRKNKQNQPDGWGMQCIIDKNDPQVAKLQKAAKKALVEKFGENALKAIKKFKMPLRDGDEEVDETTGEVPEHLQGKYFFNANNKNRKPGVVNRANEPADADDMEEMGYSGCYFHVSVNFYGFDVDGNKGVAVGLNHVMLRKKGERLDGGSSATSEFAEFADDDLGSDDDFDDDDF